MCKLPRIECPACGASDRWEGQYLETPTTLVIWCDCGQGELALSFGSTEALSR